MTQQWQSFANGKLLDFDAMAHDIQRCVGVSLDEARAELATSKLGDVFLDCVRVA